MLTKEEQTRFYRHTMQPQMNNQSEICREKACEFAQAIGNIPPGRERSIALTHIETALFFANAAIARERNPDK